MEGYIRELAVYGSALRGPVALLDDRKFKLNGGLYQKVTCEWTFRFRYVRKVRSVWKVTILMEIYIVRKVNLYGKLDPYRKLTCKKGEICTESQICMEG